MHFKKLVAISAAATAVNAISIVEVRDTLASYSEPSLEFIKRTIPALSRRKGLNCPAIWSTIVPELTALFLDNSVTPSQCNDNARAAIRAAFHDCGTWDSSQGATGGCDGSLVLAREAYDRPENNGLQAISDTFTALKKKYPSVTMADLIQVASSVAIVTCPQGPRVPTFVGRKDSSVANPNNLLPNVHADGASLFKLFSDKGFSARDLAALLGAHSTSKAFGQADIPFGAAQDDTPGIWDVHYYQNTLTPPPNVVPFQSDINLAAHPVVGKEFKGFVNNQGKWTGSFADAMGRMALLGVPGGSSNLIDCTGVIPRSTSSKREMKAMPIGDRMA